MKTLEEFEQQKREREIRINQEKNNSTNFLKRKQNSEQLMDVNPMSISKNYESQPLSNMNNFNNNYNNNMQGIKNQFNPEPMQVNNSNDQ